MPIKFLNGTARDHADFAKAQEYLMKTPQGQFLFNQAWTHNLEISFNNTHTDTMNNHTFVVSWDPRSALQVVQANGEVGAQSAALGLLHEIYHWYTKKITGSFDEYLATEYEKGAARELGEPIRENYNDLYLPRQVVHTFDTTAHADRSGWKSVQFGEIVPGPQYDPNVEVITPPSTGGGGGGEGNGGGSPNDPGGSGPTPPQTGPKNPIVIVVPASEPISEDGAAMPYFGNSASFNSYEDPVSIDIIGVPDFHF